MKWIILLFSFLYTLSAIATEVIVFDDEKVILRSFAVEENVEVDISNKYGDVIVTIGPSDSVIVQVTIKAYSEKLDRVDELMSMVNILFNS
ncbi:MAG: hypothetical protein JKY54_08915, partial [Flavobacteriales bacterium]|nr:hypothetical protein [Flavobacteriales bacterium]